MKVSPAFQFYWSDFINGTSAMTPEEVGGYIRLLCYQWDNGYIPDDDKAISAITRCQSEAIASIRVKFGLCPDGFLRNGRLESVRHAQMQFRAKQAENGKKGGKRTQNKPKPIPKTKPPLLPDEPQRGGQNQALCTPTSSSKEEEGSRRESAELIYKKYPRKVGKPEAIKALVSALATTPAETITRSLDDWIAKWTADGTEPNFIPYPATWIRRKPWDDEKPLPLFAETLSAPPSPENDPPIVPLIQIPASLRARINGEAPPEQETEYFEPTRD